MNETVKWIHSLVPLGIKPGLKRMEWMLERLGNPERRLKYIHVGGTNGKGSTVSYLRHMLQEGGLRVGTFTSPYIEFFNERIAVNGEPISDEQLDELAKSVKPLVEELAESELGSPTEFEVITTIAFLYFAKVSYPDIVIMEVGLGGRLDSTNVITPMVSLITNVGYDHMHILGESIEEIAIEKAGIIKSGVPVITTAELPEVLKIFIETAENKHAKALVLGHDFHIANEEGKRFSLQTPFASFDKLHISMEGAHQVKNAALALMGLQYLRTFYALLIEEDEIRTGLEKTFWLGRFEKVSEKPLIIIDGAHNRQGVEALTETIFRYKPRKILAMLSLTKEKDVNDTFSPLYEVCDDITFTTFDFERAQQSHELYENCRFQHKHHVENWKQGLSEMIEQTPEDDIILVAGSLYFISEVRAYFKHKEG
ncbi:bifunctional folylpolyglutamate synthase/dihydrofolate synthase [Bacillus alkalicellulosilyticus]|uniref:bifunctional folylpolyglutamate synthase/dihydrofolate synthase n=1 Tax=Alkalihalobacterium alkalicellulosilyticum TaxID=1912214 RepID=UPI000998C196|nr:folylpolyglutamate synthase/dihydrofolate synthase family protein [Bacillus alkalicellulosilyticus]